MRNPTPAPIVIPATGAPTCRGVALTVRPLAEWSRERDYEVDPDGERTDLLAQARRAVSDLHVLCLRPTTDRPASVGLSPTQFAVASLQDDFAARALVVDPYDAEGNDLREGPSTPSLTIHRSNEDERARCAEWGIQTERHWDAAVAVWEGSEAT